MSDQPKLVLGKPNVQSSFGITPDLVLLGQLMDMGIDKNVGEEALIQTRNQGISHALDWIYSQNSEKNTRREIKQNIEQPKIEKPSSTTEKESKKMIPLYDLKLRGDSLDEKVW